jgi:hypothetical protein
MKVDFGAKVILFLRGTPSAQEECSNGGLKHLQFTLQGIRIRGLYQS